MATKTDFTVQEWEALRDAPHLVMLSVATAGSSGPFGSIKEAFAPAGAIVEAAKGSNELLRGICDREELKAAQQCAKTAHRSRWARFPRYTSGSLSVFLAFALRIHQRPAF